MRRGLNEGGMNGRGMSAFVGEITRECGCAFLETYTGKSVPEKSCLFFVIVWLEPGGMHTVDCGQTRSETRAQSRLLLPHSRTAESAKAYGNWHKDVLT